MLDHQEVAIDFEINPIEALVITSVNADIYTCFLDFAQANWRKSLKSLQRIATTNSAIRTVLECIVALALVADINMFVGIH